jgi:hypothetical protein
LAAGTGAAGAPERAAVSADFFCAMLVICGCYAVQSKLCSSAYEPFKVVSAAAGNVAWVFTCSLRNSTLGTRALAKRYVHRRDIQ